MVTATATDGAMARSALTLNELKCCETLANTRRQGDFRAGRLAAKRAAREFLGPRPDRTMEVRSGADAPPRLALLDPRGSERKADIELSLSHRDGRAVAAAATAGLRIGVDLELVGAVPRRLARYFLAPSEEGLVADGDPTLLWSLKEAAWKALGLGRSMPFKSLELRCDRGGALQGVLVRGSFVPMRARVMSPWPDYQMTTVWMLGGVG